MSPILVGRGLVPRRGCIAAGPRPRPVGSAQPGSAIRSPDRNARFPLPCRAERRGETRAQPSTQARPGMALSFRPAETVGDHAREPRGSPAPVLPSFTSRSGCRRGIHPPRGSSSATRDRGPRLRRGREHTCPSSGGRARSDFKRRAGLEPASTFTSAGRNCARSRAHASSPSCTSTA